MSACRPVPANRSCEHLSEDNSGTEGPAPWHNLEVQLQGGKTPGRRPPGKPSPAALLFATPFSGGSLERRDAVHTVSKVQGPLLSSGNARDADYQTKREYCAIQQNQRTVRKLSLCPPSSDQLARTLPPSLAFLFLLELNTIWTWNLTHVRCQGYNGYTVVVFVYIQVCL